MVGYTHGHIGGVVAALLLAVVIPMAADALKSKRVDYEYFDEYLLSIKLPEEHAHNQVLTSKRTAVQQTTDDEDMQAGSGDDLEDIQDKDAFRAKAADILGYFRDVPREHWSCCMLGKLAGDKGFHCHAGFYQARITLRNRNRAHNKKMHFHGRDRIPNWGLEIMRTFQRCVARHASEFHKCCYAAGVEQRERNRWSFYRQHTKPAPTTTTVKPKVVDAMRQRQVSDEDIQSLTRTVDQTRQRPADVIRRAGSEATNRRAGSETTNRRAGSETTNRRTGGEAAQRRTRTEEALKRPTMDNTRRTRTEEAHRRTRTGVAQPGQQRPERDRRVRPRVHASQRHRAASRHRAATGTQQARERIRQMTRQQGQQGNRH